jgi:hypothetical protein
MDTPDPVYRLHRAVRNSTIMNHAGKPCDTRPKCQFDPPLCGVDKHDVRDGSGYNNIPRENDMPTSSKRVSRLHSKDPADAAWRARQAQVDADIEGLSRDAGVDRFVAEMEASGVAPRQRIKRLKAYLRARQNPQMGGP